MWRRTALRTLGAISLCGGYVAASKVYSSTFVYQEAPRSTSTVPNRIVPKDVTETRTGCVIPSAIILKMNDDHINKHQLLGFGARTLSFLKIPVYAIGVYADARVLTDSWFIKQILSNTKDMDSDNFIHSFLQSPVEVSVRIIPARNTSGIHMRDGFERALREQLDRERTNLEPEEIRSIEENIRNLGTLLPNATIPKHSPVTLIKQSQGYLAVMLEDQFMGVVASRWVANRLFMAYLRRDRPISVEARSSVIQGLQEISNSDSALK